jgi:hypothetical protein
MQDGWMSNKNVMKEGRRGPRLIPITLNIQLHTQIFWIFPIISGQQGKQFNPQNIISQPSETLSRCWIYSSNLQSRAITDLF